MKKVTSSLWVLALLFIPTVAFASQGGEAEVTLTHRMMLLVIQLGIILFAVKIGSMLFEKIGLPSVLGELFAGMIIGPYALGGIGFAGFENGLFPIFSAEFPISPELYAFGTVAAIILLFIVGLETDLQLFKTYYLAGSAVGIGGVAVSFIFGDVIAVLFGEWVFGTPISFMDPPALFLGAIATATSVGISARILSEKRKIGSPEGVTILAGAVIDDVLGIILLAIILGVISASQETGSINWGHIGIIALKAVGIWITATVIGLVAARRISALLKFFKNRTAIALRALGMALILAGLFEEAGLAMIIGAYVMGLSLSHTDISLVIQEKLSPLHNFLVPVFFCIMGMLVDFRAISSPQIIIFGFVYAIIAILAKILGCSTPTLFFNFNLRGALRVGFGMVPRAEVALIMAGIGLARGVFPTKIFGVVIIMMMITMLTTPLILELLFKNPAPGTRKKVKIAEKMSVPFSFPSPEITYLVVRQLVELFEADGFYVNIFDYKEKLYQIRKDEIILNFQYTQEEVIFHCKDSDLPLVNGTMLEVLVELEKTIKKMQRPIDKREMEKRLKTPVKGPATKFNLSNYISPQSLTTNLEGYSKEDIINELLNLLVKSGKVKNIEKASEAIWEREHSMSTGMQYGIAIPHGRTDSVKRLVCAIGIKPDGIDFGSIDGQPSKIFILTLSPKSAAAPHVQFMSTVSHIFSDESMRTRVLQCTSKSELYKLLTGKSNKK